MAKERHKIVPSSYLALIKDNKILMQRRFNTGYEDGKYGLPAGHVEAKENFTSAVIIEIKEEIGVTLSPGSLKVNHVMSRYGGEENERIDIFFTTENWDGKIENKEPNKCDDLSWFDLDNMPENTIPYVRHAIECVKNKTFYSEYGWN